MRRFYGHGESRSSIVVSAWRVAVSEEGEEKREHPAPKICTHDNIMTNDDDTKCSAVTLLLRLQCGRFDHRWEALELLYRLRGV